MFDDLSDDQLKCLNRCGDVLMPPFKKLMKSEADPGCVIAVLVELICKAAKSDKASAHVRLDSAICALENSRNLIRSRQTYES